MGNKRNKNDKQRIRQQRRFSVRGVRRDPPDARKLARALIRLAQAETERQAQAEHDAHKKTDGTTDEQHHGGQPTDDGGDDDGTRHG